MSYDITLIDGKLLICNTLHYNITVIDVYVNKYTTNV